MKIEDVERHAAHLCDVFVSNDQTDHMGVIEEYVRLGDTNLANVLVSGHPNYDPMWFLSDDLMSECLL